MRDKVPNVKANGYGSFRTDMFGRIKVADAFTLFDSSHRYSENGDFSDLTANGGSVTYQARESTALLNVTGQNGSRAYRESKKVFPYQPGKSLQVMQTFVFSEPRTNLRQRVGYYSRENGFYLEQDGTDVYFVKRSSVTGSIVETRIAQSEWNIDPLNGEGPSDLVLDLTKAQILWSEYEWLGVGSVRLGFVIDGYLIVCHQFNHANVETGVYITTASLPVAYEIYNKAATGGSSTMKQICVTVISNGGYTRQTERWTATGSVAANTSWKPVVSIRLTPGRTDSVILPTGVGFMVGNAGNVEWAVFRNSTLTSPSWTAHSGTPNVQYDTTATNTLTDGVIIRQGYFAGSNQGAGAVDVSDGFGTFDMQLGRTNSDTPVSDILTLAVRTISGSGTMYGSLSFNDLL